MLPKACPCCGSSETNLVMRGEDENCVICRDCRLQTGWYTTSFEAVTIWNQRAHEPYVIALKAKFAKAMRYLESAEGEKGDRVGQKVNAINYRAWKNLIKSRKVQ